MRTECRRPRERGSRLLPVPLHPARPPALQILTVADLLEGKRIDYPAHAQTNVTFKKAPKAKRKGKNVKEVDLFEEGEDAE